MDNWNDLKLVLAIARGGSLGKGAALLAINHSTAFRNLNALEAKIGARLFERLPGGVYAPTAVGGQVARTAERMETEANALDREVTGSDARLVGTLRVTASETLAYRVLTRQLSRFREVHPGITVQLLIDNRIFDLSRREADVALRVARPKDPDLFGKKLAAIGWTVYGSPRYAAKAVEASLDTLRDMPFVGWSEDVSAVAAADWLAGTVKPRQVVYRSNSLINQFCAAREGIGLAVLPCYLADGEAGVVRMLPEPVAELERELWIVTHEDLKNTARIRAFLDVVGSGLSEQKSLFAGVPVDDI
jgi:DNA-binding transcriptional LysR family regulator